MPKGTTPRSWGAALSGQVMTRCGRLSRHALRARRTSGAGTGAASPPRSERGEKAQADPLSDRLVDLQSHQVIGPGNRVAHLTPKEFNVLQYLLAHANKSVSHRMIAGAVWQRDGYGDFEYLRVVIGQLRRKLEPNPEIPRLYQKLASLEREQEHLKAGLGLLGIRPCTRCGVFYRRADAGALCDCGELVCYNCIPQWWQHRSPQLSAKGRQAVEREMRQWLVSHHNAQVIGKAEDLPKPDRLIMKLVTGCEQCDGIGKTSAGRPGHHCDGRGTVWVVIRAPEFA